MVQKLIKTVMVIFGCILLVSCGGERRVNGEMAFDSDSLMVMADSFMKAGDYGNAMRLYQRAANENPHHIGSRLGLAKTYQEIGATDASINFYNQVLKLDPNNPEAKKGIGQMLITKNRPADAIPYLMDILKKDPKNYRIYNMLGLAYDLMGDQKNAQMNYAQGLDVAPDNISLLNNLALSFAFESQYAPSIKLLSKAINLDRTVTKAQQNLVMVYVLSGEEDAGRAIGASIMTKEEIENNIRHYRWVKNLTPTERAQAIFLGIKNFPSDSKALIKNLTNGDLENLPAQAIQEPSPDPKKQRLLDILNQETTRKKNQEITQKPQEKLAAPQEGLTVREDKQPAIENKEVEDVKQPAVISNNKENQDVKQPAVISSNKENQDVKQPAAISSNKENQEKEVKIFRVQLGSFPNTQLAHKGWQEIKNRGEGILDSYKPLIKLVILDQEKTSFRLYIDNIEEKTVARNLCDQLKVKNIDCLVLKTTK